MPSRPFIAPQIINSISYDAERTRVDRPVDASDQYPLLNDIYDIVPLPFIHYEPIPCGSDLPTDSLRLVRNVTDSPPVFPTLPLRHTLPDKANIREDFVAAMRTTINWVADGKRNNGRKRVPSAEAKAEYGLSSKKKCGPPRVHKDTWTFRCPCGGQPRKKTDEPSVLSTPEFIVKRKSQPSMKVGCPARFTIKKRIDNGLFELVWYWEHANHNPYSLADMKRMRLAAPVRKWLCERVLAGMDWPAIKRLLMSPDLLGKDIANCKYIPKLVNINYQTVQNMVHKQADKLIHLDPNPYRSLQAWGQKLREGGWHVRDRFLEHDGWISFCFFSPWQKEQLHAYGGDIVCLDSTHNTTNNFQKDFSNLKLSLFTIVIRSPVTGKGVPVVWFLTSNEKS
ncbi:hypothetical protein DFH28DRAFT_891842 [Melampsora americana]|nr:hypothetical protein DFH28DRAFT_891842 [Melampsora americana]